MTKQAFFHEGSRALQDRFASRAIADRLEELLRAEFTDDDRTFIEAASYFFLATADGQGRPDCSFMGGPVGFVRLTAANELAFPDYDGNGMFRSLGNLMVNPQVALLFIGLHGAPRRLRVNGAARIDVHDPLLEQTVGAQMIVRVTAQVIFPNCPRYIPAMQLIEPSAYTPRAGEQPLEPAWKDFEVFKGLVHPRHKTFTG